MDVSLEPTASKFSAEITLWWTHKHQSLISGKTGTGTHRVGFRVVPGCFEEEKKLLLLPGI
jgi:RES domain-containing protein